MDREWWAKEWNRTKYDQIRYEQVIGRLKQILGNKCAECDATEDLEFDHINPTTKKFSIAKMWNRGDKVLLPELTKCQLLCGEHHRAKTTMMRSVEHGGGISGKRNCKCAPCRAKKAEYMRAWKTQKNIESL